MLFKNVPKPDLFLLNCFFFSIIDFAISFYTVVFKFHELQIILILKYAVYSNRSTIAKLYLFHPTQKICSLKRDFFQFMPNLMLFEVSYYELKSFLLLLKPKSFLHY